MNSFGHRLINWYRKNSTRYPWRETSDPYSVWLSEILLQQTRIPVALKFYDAILKQYPTLTELASAQEQEFLALWSGIGYYSRARNMLRCAQELVARHNGQFPRDHAKLLELPGIGPYTAGALRNFCFGELTPAIDGNVNRVLARITNNDSPVHSKKFRSAIQAAYLEFGKRVNAGEYAQALMELGEQICTPVAQCAECPVIMNCESYRRKTVSSIPKRVVKRAPVTYFWYFLFLQKASNHYYVQNNAREFLKHAWLFPDVLSRHELSVGEVRKSFRKQWGIDAKKISLITAVNHTVTYRKIRAIVLQASDCSFAGSKGVWLNPLEMKSYPTSSVVLKILKKIPLVAGAL